MRLAIMAGSAAGLVELGEGVDARRGVGTSPAGNIQPQSSQKACFPFRGAEQLGQSCGMASVAGLGASITGGAGGDGGTTGIASGGDAAVSLTGMASGAEAGSSFSERASQSGKNSSWPAGSCAAVFARSGVSLFSSRRSV